MQTSSTKLTQAQTNALLKKIERISELSPFVHKSTKAFVSDLSFYPTYRLIEFSDTTAFPARRMYVIEGPNGITIIPHTKTGLGDLNKHCGLLVSEKTIADYAAFYLRFLRLDTGHVQPLQTADDLMLRDELPPAQRKILSSTIKPATYDPATGLVELCALFGTGLFKVKLSVTEDGTLAIQERELLFADLPVFDDATGL